MRSIPILKIQKVKIEFDFARGSNSFSSVLRAALMALTAVASCGEIAAMRIISPAKNQSGIEIIVKAMETNITNKDCCEEFCLFLDEMLEEPDIKGIFEKTIKFVQSVF